MDKVYRIQIIRILISIGGLILLMSSCTNHGSSEINVSSSELPDRGDSSKGTLFLTSSGMGLSSSWLAPLLPFDPADRTVCYITTAAAFGGEVPDWIKNEIEALEKIGFDVDEVDLTHVEVEQLDETFAGCDLYWVGGGNTLYLLQEVRRSGFDDFVTGKILEGVPYVGVSAGSVIMGPDIEFELFSSRTPELTSYEGLDLFPFAPFVHFGNPEYKSIYKDILDHSLDAGLSFITVSDSQFIYVTGNKWEVMNIE